MLNKFESLLDSKLSELDNSFINFSSLISTNINAIMYLLKYKCEMLELFIKFNNLIFIGIFEDYNKDLVELITCLVNVNDKLNFTCAATDLDCVHCVGKSVNPRYPRPIVVWFISNLKNIQIYSVRKLLNIYYFLLRDVTCWL